MRRALFLAVALAACSETAPPSADDVGDRVPATEQRAEPAERVELYDARGVPLPSDVRVAGLVLPRGLTEVEALSRDRLHVYSSVISRDALLRYFGPRLTTMNVEQRGEVVVYHEAAPRDARGAIVPLDVTIRPSSAQAARVEIFERPPRAAGTVVSEDEIRRHLESLTKNRE